MILRTNQIELQIINAYRIGFKAFLNEQQIYFRKIELYMKAFDKCFNVNNIMSYKGMKIPQIKAVVESFAAKKKINLTVFDNQ